jgi:hypothetical protein
VTTKPIYMPLDGGYVRAVLDTETNLVTLKILAWRPKRRTTEHLIHWCSRAGMPVPDGPFASLFSDLNARIRERLVN